MADELEKINLDFENCILLSTDSKQYCDSLLQKLEQLSQNENFNFKETFLLLTKLKRKNKEINSFYLKWDDFHKESNDKCDKLTLELQNIYNQIHYLNEEILSKCNQGIDFSKMEFCQDFQMFLNSQDIKTMNHKERHTKIIDYLKNEIDQRKISQTYHLEASEHLELLKSVNSSLENKLLNIYPFIESISQASDPLLKVLNDEDSFNFLNDSEYVAKLPKSLFLLYSKVRQTLFKENKMQKDYGLRIQYNDNFPHLCNQYSINLTFRNIIPGDESSVEVVFCYSEEKNVVLIKILTDIVSELGLEYLKFLWDPNNLLKNLFYVEDETVEKIPEENFYYYDWVQVMSGNTYKNFHFNKELFNKMNSLTTLDFYEKIRQRIIYRHVLTDQLNNLCHGTLNQNFTLSVFNVEMNDFTILNPKINQENDNFLCSFQGSIRMHLNIVSVEIKIDIPFGNGHLIEVENHPVDNSCCMLSINTFEMKISEEKKDLVKQFKRCIQKCININLPIFIGNNDESLQLKKLKEELASFYHTEMICHMDFVVTHQILHLEIFLKMLTYVISSKKLAELFMSLPYQVRKRIENVQINHISNIKSNKLRNFFHVLYNKY